MSPPAALQPGARIEVAPSAYGWDAWRGPATVVEVRGRDVLVEIGNTEVWFDVGRIVDLTA